MNKTVITYSIWALFKDTDEKFLKKNKKLTDFHLSDPGITNISDFPVHMTLNSNIDKDSKNLKQNIKKIKKFEIQAVDYFYKKMFFKSFFIGIKSEKNLINISNFFNAKKNVKNEYFSPHISLCYGNQKNKIKKRSIDALPIIKDKVFKINRLCIAMNDEKNFKWKIIKIFKI